MPWLIGIDEAGYGPNLGPLVMTAVSCRVPAQHAGGRLWTALRAGVRRPAQPDDGRLCVDDSKQVFSQASGLGQLEKAVLAAVAPAVSANHDRRWALSHVIDQLAPAGTMELVAEPWYQGSTLLPLAADRDALQPAADKFHRACTDNQICWGRIRSAIVCPTRFNGLVDRWGSKGAVLGLAMTDLIRESWNADDTDEAVAFVIDKHGGRNHYSALLQHAMDEGMVLAREENAQRSRYEVIGLPRPVSMTFLPRADAGHFCVALASMVSKYLREVLMHEFNRFWQGHLADLEPTAGYPGDARRFFEQIRPLLPRLDIAESVLWRQR